MAATAQATEQLTITLPKDLVDIIRAEVSSGRFSSDADFVGAAVEAVVAKEVLTPVSQPFLNEWMLTEGSRIVRELQTDPSKGLTPEDLDASLAATEEEDFRPFAKDL